MPRDVIMPALGVAQDTGLILAWLKHSGDAIKIGDALMEIETDKAVVEVEAQADGYLTSVSAAAGDHVPVGRIVAVISETVVANDSAVPDNSDALAQSGTAVDASVESMPEGKEIIMPALGMAQDTGLIVAWRKNPGDSVLATDILLDVETDKSVMEVEAGHDGFVAAILADAQQAVPVGSTIAIISAVKPQTIVSRSRAVTSSSTEPDTHEPATRTTAALTVSAANTQPAHATNSSDESDAVSSDDYGARILASPKVRRLAYEQGLDLERLAAHGVPQPYHVADLETLKTLSKASTLPDTTTQSHAGSTTKVVLRVDARVPASGHVEFIDWLAEIRDLTLPPRMVWLRYATAALRQATSRASDPLIVEVRQVRDADGCFADADRSRLSKPVTERFDLPPALVLRDFSESAITSVTSSAHVAPVLTIRRERDDYLISLDYSAEHLDESEAIDFTTHFADRLAEPLRHLL